MKSFKWYQFSLFSAINTHICDLSPDSDTDHKQLNTITICKYYFFYRIYVLSIMSFEHNSIISNDNILEEIICCT
jgi:hypothetical protein